jgi:hypothetical protein
MYVKRNTEARSRNHFRRKQQVLTYSVRVSVCSFSYPACKAHSPYYIVICGLSVPIVFFNINV